MSQANLCVSYIAVFLLCCACLLVLHTSNFSTMPANANWENYSIPSLEYMQQFRAAFDSVFFEI